MPCLMFNRRLVIVDGRHPFDETDQHGKSERDQDDDEDRCETLAEQFRDDRDDQADQKGPSGRRRESNARRVAPKIICSPGLG